MDQFGTQGSFEGVSKAADTFKEGSKLFKTSVGEWTFGLIGLTKVLTPNTEQLKGVTKTTLRLTGVLKDLGDAFTTAKIVDVVADLSTAMYDTGKQLQRSFGIFGADNRVFQESIRETSQITNDFGFRMRENTETLMALANEFKGLAFSRDLVEATSLIRAAYGISAEASANITFALNQFAGLGNSGIIQYMDGVANAATQAGLTSEMVAENMAASSKYMYRFRLDTDRGRQGFQRMLVYSTKIGKNVGDMVESMDQFRTIPGAIEGSVTASLAGLNLSAGQLLANARGGDPTALTNQVLTYLNRFTDSQGRISQVGIDLANQLGGMIGMNTEEIQKAIAIQFHSNTEMGREFIKMRDRARMQQDIMTKIENAMFGLLQAVQPAAHAVLSILEWVTNHTKLTQTLLGVTAAGWAFMKSKGFIMAMAKGIGQWGGVGASARAFVDRGYGGGMGKAGSIDRLRYMFGRTPVGADDNVGFGRGQTRPRRPDGTFGTGMSPKQMAGQAKMMAASAVGMIAFAGAMWILSKAFQNFSSVKWDGVKYGLAVMGGFTAAMLLLGTVVSIGWAPMLAMGAMMVAFAGSTWILAQALGAFVDPVKSLSGVDFTGIGLGFGSLAIGLGALMLVGASGPLGWLALASGMIMSVKAIEAIGQVAIKYANPIETLSYAIERLANAMTILKGLEVEGVPIKIDKGAVTELDKVAKSLAATRATSSKEIIENHITLNIDGKKLMRHIAKSEAVRS